MNQLPLPGLIGSQPVCALAAFGLLRVCSSTQLGPVKLSWDLDGTGRAVLWFEQQVSGNDLIGKALLPWMSGRWVCRVFGAGVPGQKTDEDGTTGSDVGSEADGVTTSKASRNRGKALKWDNDIKVSRDTFSAVLRAERDNSSPACRGNADYLVGYGTDAREVSSSSKGKVVATTALCMTAGQQTLLQLLRDLAFTLDCGGEWSRPLNEKKTKMARIPPEDAFRQSLLAEWDFNQAIIQDMGFKSLGWDAESYYVAALRGQATPDFTPPRAAIWLAAESLPLFPCTAIMRGRVQTRGFDPKGEVFRWPLWRQPLSLRAVQAAIGHPAIYEKQVNSEVIQAFGIDQVYGSGIIALTDYASFRPPTLLAEGRGEQVASAME